MKRGSDERTLVFFCFATLLLLLISGTTLFYHIEKWSLVDSFYFAGHTMMTVGYGDIAPKTEVGKIASVLFAFASVGLALYSVNVLARLAFKHRLEDRKLFRRKH
jgi:hypothetical protein